MWKHTVRTPKHPKLVPIVIPWRQSFQPVHTWEPEKPNTGMFYSELCNSIPNFAFHIHTLSKGSEKKADIETLGHSSAVCKGVVAFLLSSTVQKQNFPIRVVWNWSSPPGTAGRAGSREEGEQVHGAVTVFPLAFRSSGGTVSAWLSQTSLILADLIQGTLLSHNWAQRPLKPPENPVTDKQSLKSCCSLSWCQSIFVSHLTP